jgi:hypothetical protein
VYKRQEPNLSKNITTKSLKRYEYGNEVVYFLSKHFAGITNFKEYLNEHYDFNYIIQRHKDKFYYLNEENLFRDLTPIVKKYGRLPSRLELEANGRRDIDRFIKRQFGGFKDMRRNEIQIGKYFHIIDNMLDGKAPWDLKLDWDTNPLDTIDKILNYWKSNNIDLPYYFVDLENDNIYGSLGKQLYNVISRRKFFKTNIDGWTDFKRKYDGYNGPEIPEKPVKKIQIEIGSTIGNWHILKELDFKYYISKKGSRVRNFLCRCVCGTEKEISIKTITSERSSCGCKSKSEIDYSRKYGKLTIIEEVDIRKGKNRNVMVKCDCGSPIKKIQLTYVKNGVITNCGCEKPKGK